MTIEFLLSDLDPSLNDIKQVPMKYLEQNWLTLQQVWTSLEQILLTFQVFLNDLEQA